MNTFLNFQYNYPPNFKARNNKIREADNIRRNAACQYPAISSTRPEYYKVTKYNPALLKLTDNTNGTILMLRALGIFKNTTKDKLERTLELVKDLKVGNCKEMTQIATAAFIANGYKDVKLVNLTHPTKLDLIDHCFLLINSGKVSEDDNLKSLNKQAFIVDPWLGFVDYVPNAIIKYNTFFENKLKKHNCTFEELEIQDCTEIEVDDNICDKFEKIFPNLVCKTINN